MSFDETRNRPQPGIEVNAHILHRGLKSWFKDKEVHVRGFAPDPRTFENFLEAVSLRTNDGGEVVPHVEHVWLPVTALDWERSTPGNLVLTQRSESRLPSSTSKLLREAASKGVFGLTELREVAKYDEAARHLGISPDSMLTTLGQANQILVVSDWIGPNIQQFLSQDEEVAIKHQQDVAELLAKTLKTLHQAGLIAGDTHIEQFVVGQDEEGKVNKVVRIDLINIYSVKRQQASPENFTIELHGLARELAMTYPAAAQAFWDGYHGK